jgi:hypothetical protein
MKELLKWQKRIKSFGNNEAVLAAFAKHDKSGAISRMALASAKKAEQEVRLLRCKKLWIPWHRNFDIWTESQRGVERAVAVGERSDQEGASTKESSA